VQNVQPIVKPDPEQMRKQLAHLFGEVMRGYVELAWTSGKSDQVSKAEYFRVDQLDEFIERAVEINSSDGCNVYVGAALRRPDSAPFGRSEDKDFYSLPAPYVDLDDPGAADKVQEIYRAKRCPPTGVTITGRHPHKRAQLYWLLDEPVTDPSKCRAVNAGLADALGGDRSVANPGRVMRLAGSVAWPKKQGRIRECTEWFDIQAGTYLFEQVVNAFGVSASDTEKPQQTNDAPRKAISGRIDIERALEATKEQGRWHHNMVAAIASMVSAGWSDEQIRLACAPYCDQGAHDPDLDPIIDTARKKWNKPDPDDGAAETEEAENTSTPFSADQLKGTAPPRQWLVENWIPERTVSSLYGDGGAGKTLLAQQLAYSMAIGAPWLGIPVKPGKSLCVFCEDERDELHLRHDAIKANLNHTIGNPFGDVHLWPRVGHNNLLVTFDTAGRPSETPFFRRVLEEVERLDVDLLILDTAADLFGGNEIVRVQVNYFIKSVCGKAIRLAKERYRNLSVLLLAHPSAAGMASGAGTGGSTGWNAAVRSRLYLTKPENGLDEERILTRMKANYASSGEETGVHLVFNSGVLTPTSRAGDDTVFRIELNNAQRKIREMVDHAWNEKRPYKPTKTSDRYLYRAITDELTRDGMNKEIVVEALRRMVVNEDIVKGRNKDMRGWKVAEND
jgi:RecA-family ATPase